MFKRSAIYVSCLLATIAMTSANGQIKGIKEIVNPIDALKSNTKVEEGSEPEVKIQVPEVQDIRFDGDKGEIANMSLILPMGEYEIVKRKESKNLFIEVKDILLPKKLQRVANVENWGTPVTRITSSYKEGNVLLNIELKNDLFYDFEVLENISNNNKEVLVRIKEIEPPKVVAKKPKIYTGEKIDLVFQDIEVRALLQMIAEHAEQNIAVSDSVTGNITLQLTNTPWDQALDTILKTKGLGKRVEGNLIFVAPATELADREKAELAAAKALSELESLETRYIQINYAKAEEVTPIIEKLLTERGRVIFDSRTNLLLVEDVRSKVDEIEKTTRKIDIPVKQVVIESRIVVANDDYNEELGMRLGFGNADGILNGDGLVVGNSSNTNIDAVNGTGNLVPNIVNLPANISSGGASAAFSILTSSTYLDIELSAFEEEGKAETIAKPKVVTADKKPAVIKTGTEIPYVEASDDGGTASIKFREAVLSLKVTPQITPDDKIILDLEINQDTVGQVTSNGPAIDTTEITTQILVEDGETIVIGGIFKDQVVGAETRIPILGSLPGIGKFFRRTVKEIERSELLFFITPKLLD